MTPFSGMPGRTVNIDVSNTSQSVQITTVKDGLCPRQIRIMNNGSATVWVRFAKADAIAAVATADMPVGPGLHEVQTAKISDGPIWVSAIAAASTGKVYFTPGSGI